MRNFLLLLVLFYSTFSFSQQTENSLFWEISGNGLTKKSYLYGTMHVRDSRVFQLSNATYHALDNADVFLMELNNDSIDPFSMMQSLAMKNGTTIKDLVNKKDYRMIENYFIDSLKSSLVPFNAMQPFFVAFMVDGGGFNAEENEALDLTLFSRAKSKNIPCFGLETIEEQINAFSSLPYDYQANYLVEIIKNKYKGIIESDQDKLLSYYLNGELEKLLTYTMVNFNDPKIKAIFEQNFITLRNQVMTTRMLPFLDQGSTFIAVGAAHLGGQNGIIALLQKLGYTVTAL